VFRAIQTLWRDYWWARQRSIDLQCLWPACKDMAGGDLHRAHEAFFLHAFNDRAWVMTYKENLWTEVIKLR